MKTKNLLLVFFSLAMLSFFVIQYGCKKDKPDPEPPPQIDELILSEDVVEIDTTQLGVPVIEGDNYTFTDNGNLPEFKEGDIIVGNLGYGYMRKITSISTQGDDIVLTTSQATLEEVIENCNIQDEIQLTLDKAIYKGKEYPAKVVFLAEGASISEKGGINLSGFQIFSGTYGGVDVTAQIDQGSITFEPVFTREIEIRMFKLKHLRLSSGGDLDFTCDASVMVNAPVSFEKDKLVAQIYFGPFPFGPVPVYIVLSFNAGINANLNITGSIGSGFDTEAYLEYGADYTDSQWTTIWEKSFDSNSHGVTWDLSGETNSKVYVSPEVGLLVAGVAGPYMEAVPYLGFDGNISLGNQTWDWDLAAGAEGNIGFIVQILGHSVANYNTTLANWEAIIAQDNGSISGYIPVANFTSDQTTITVGEVVNFTDQSTNSPTSWSWNFGDDGTSTAQNPSYTYSNAGTYTVSLTATNANGSNTKTKNSYITVTSNWQCGDSLTDNRNGQIYNTVQIGNQCWMAENLNFNGTCYNWSADNCDTYGGLYDWLAATQACPVGWHLPSNTEWTELINYHGGTNVAGGKMKSTSLWNPPNTGATNEHGFTALPAGYYAPPNSPYFYNLGNRTVFWSSTAAPDCQGYQMAYARKLKYDVANISGSNNSWARSFGFSVRCVKD